MSQRINPCRLVNSIGIRSAGYQIPMICLRNSECIQFELARRSVSRRNQPKSSSIQLDRSLWGLTGITRTVRKYLGAGKDYISILKSNPPQDDILEAIQFWNSLSKASVKSRSSYQSSAEMYELFRHIRVRHKRETLTADNVRSVLASLTLLRPSVHSSTGFYPQRMFLDLPDIWESAWTVNDFVTIFEILRWNGTFEEAISTMEIIYENVPLEKYPDADCWARLIDGLSGNRNITTLRKAKEAWRLMRHHGTEPTIVTFEALFGVLCTLPEAFDFVTEVYHTQLLASNYSPSHITLRYLLEIYMNRTRTKEVIAEGNKLFDQLLDFKSTKSQDPLFWDPVLKWMLFRGDSLRVIKHTLYEQNAALGRNLHIDPANSHGSTVVRTILDDRYSSAVASTLDHLIDVALRIDNENAANTICEEFFPAFDVTPTVSTDEMRLEMLIRTKQAEVAKSLYDDLQFQGHRPAASTVVRLIQTLASDDHPLPLEVQSVFFDLLDDQECPPETYTASFSILATLLLRIGDYPRMRQTLQDRQIDRVPNWQHTLSNICLDIISDPKNVWLEPLLPVYHILQRWTPNTISVSHRHTLMQKFISHGRTDLGLELFHDMRHSDVSQPTKETYAIMLSGCAKTRDAQTLEHIHNALRLDSSIEPDSALFNSLMLAYNRSRLPEKALAIWEVLSQSSRPPDVQTASLALDACVRLPRYGLIRAREIWIYMEDNHINPVASSYAALLSVFASVGKWDSMMGLLERMDRDKVDARVLGTAYNSMRRDRKWEVELWAKTNKPEVWEYLQQLN